MDQFDVGLPEFLTGFYGGFACVPAAGGAAAPGRLPLSALLSQALHWFALEFERESKLSLKYSANVIRVLDQTGVRVSDLPLRSGVASEPIRTALGYLTKSGHVIVESDPAASRGKVARLTGKGRTAQLVYAQLPGEIEQRWRARFGDPEIHALRVSLEELDEAPDDRRSRLWLGLEPPPGNWRAKVPKPNLLPHYPMPRQGGHPDGS